MSKYDAIVCFFFIGIGITVFHYQYNVLPEIQDKNIEDLKEIKNFYKTKVDSIKKSHKNEINTAELKVKTERDTYWMDSLLLLKQEIQGSQKEILGFKDTIKTLKTKIIRLEKDLKFTKTELEKESNKPKIYMANEKNNKMRIKSQINSKDEMLAKSILTVFFITVFSFFIWILRLRFLSKKRRLNF